MYAISILVNLYNFTTDLITTYWWQKSALDWRTSKGSKRVNQDGIWRSYVLNDRRCKTLRGGDSVQQNVQVGMWKCSVTV